MKKGSLILFTFFLLFALCSARAKEKSEYKNREGQRVVILPVGKPTGHEDHESRIEFYGANDKVLCSLDYSSVDGEHGFGVVKAAWTQDGRYFVFSLYSSGGHQSWHYPTHFYSTQDSRIYSLDDFVKASGISKGDFALIAPNEISTELWKGESIPVRLRLDSLIARSYNTATRAINCTDAKTIKSQD